MWLESSNSVYPLLQTHTTLTVVWAARKRRRRRDSFSLRSPCAEWGLRRGSIRMPAAFNGVFGHKPSGGSIPNTGQVSLPQVHARPRGRHT